MLLLTASMSISETFGTCPEDLLFKIKNQNLWRKCEKDFKKQRRYFTFLNGLKLPTQKIVESFTMETKPDVHSIDPYELALPDERLNLLEPGIAATGHRRSSV